MKKYIIILFSILISLTTLAQTSSYDAQWKQIYEFIKKQKSQDAEKKIRQLLTRAKKEKNTEQTIKSLIFLRKAIAQRDEKETTTTIQDFENEIVGLDFPEKNIMHSMIASLYHSYYQNNRWKIYKRTEVTSATDLKYPKDIETWTPQLFFNKIQEQYDASLKNTSGLKKYSTAQFPELITQGKNTKNLHPTLFDVLVHRAIDYYQNTEIDITKAAYYFKLKSDQAFASPKEFSQYVFKTQDDYSTKYIALSYLQLATRFHLNDKQPDALIDITAKRLQYVFNHYDGLKRSQKYQAALQRLIKQYPTNETIAKPMLLLAQSMQSTDKSKALKWAQRIQERFPKSIEMRAAKRLEQQIKMETLTFVTEKADIAGKNILGKITFKNLKNVHFKIIPLTYTQFKERSYNYQANKFIPTGQPLREWNINLTNGTWTGNKKYETHETEVIIEKLPLGYYAIIAAGDPSFSQKKTPVSFSLFQTCSISYVVSALNNQNVLYVLDRQSGKPLQNAQVTRYIKRYDYKTRKNKTEKVDSKTTDKDGRIIYSKINGKGYGSYDIEIAYNKQKLWARRAFSTQRRNQPKEQNHLYLFTDRAIYRPGQTIYFKGIYINSSGNQKKHKTLANKKVELVLKDANYKEVKKQTFTTNSYGSIQGTFIVPEGLLNGRFTLYSSQGSHQIRVEEYKRPKFEVKMDSIQNNVKLGEQVTVSGQAKTYAGNAVEGAKVRYTVRRKARWPYYWRFFYWGGSQRNNEIVLAQGETTTDLGGKFDVTFLAEGDALIDPRTKPFYDFEVNADVTDINGEVRSGKMSYSISQESLVLSVDIPNQANFNEFNSIKVSTRNVQGKYTPTDVRLEFFQLIAPTKFLKKRLWTAPKENFLTQADFNQYFPDYEYKNESNPLFWKEGKKVWTKTIRTKIDQPIYLQKIAPEDGYYMLKVSARDKEGRLIEEKKVIRLVNIEHRQAQSNEALFTYLNKNDFEPGDQALVSVSSAFRNPYIHKSISRQESITYDWDQKTEIFSIQEHDRGGFIANYFTIRNNRFYQKRVLINVPWDNKDLNITYETFRDKILPNSQQEWKIKISGHKKEQVSAELLATMYDASLDAFVKNSWSPLKLYGSRPEYLNWNTSSFGTATHRTLRKKNVYIRDNKYRKYPRLNMYGLTSSSYERRFRGMADQALESASIAVPPTQKVSAGKIKMDRLSGEANEASSELAANQRELKKEEDKTTSTGNFDEVSIRTNMNETAFFFPDLKTDRNGNIILSFTAPEALTRWNVKAFAHTTDLKTALLEKTLITQKELMLTPNHPRFMRENDNMVYSSKLTNLSQKELSGSAQLEIIHAKTNKRIDELFKNNNKIQQFVIAPNQSNELTWNLTIPPAFTGPVIVRIVAKADGFSDGEQKAIPLLLNSILVTETLPLPVRANSTKKFDFKKLRNSRTSSTLKHHRLTVEYTANPAWYAVQALPYLTDYPYDCSEQTFNRYYANVLAAHIANNSPRIQRIFSEWKAQDTAALLSNLEKNQELKNALLQETPWVFESENEMEQKKLIANLFNMNRMSHELKNTLIKLEKLQTANGGFAWFKGMRDNRYITQYIVTGIGRLQKLGVSDVQSNSRIQSILDKAVPYLDKRIVEDYQYLKRKGLLKNRNLSYSQIQYMYMRSFFQDRTMNVKTKTALNYYKNKGTKLWMHYNKYMQGMLAISMNRFQEKQTARDIMDALRQNAIHKEEMGMYWKELNQGSYWWYQAPIEAHSLLIEAFQEMPSPGIASRAKTEVDELRIWLLKQKQTQQWKTTTATADACYALLLGGMNWLDAEPEVHMQLGNKKITLSDYKQEAGTGYTKFHFHKKEIQPEMGDIEVSVKTDKAVGTTWGAMYWQYFEQLDKITESETPLSLKKQVYKVVNGDRGEQLVLLKPDEPLQVGDKIKVRIELRVDRRMEFVHMKDMRGACFEPINVLSNYKYQNGLGYYESTKDASTQFFFDNLNPGTYVFEYPMFATMRGNYSNGIATIQCMYAPEFSSHSEGLSVQVK